jgi:2-polyprenyl-3-methyl-5-hydroxy-6-metoxy-1,4-benzoquinol methylase
VSSPSRACPACGSTDSAVAFRGDPRYRRCRRCRTVVDVAPPDPAALAALYAGRGYYVKDGEGDDGAATSDPAVGYAVDYLADRPFIEAKFDEALAHVERYVPVGRLLDVGAGPGFLVAAARRRGWEARGVDLNPWASAHAREVVGVDVAVGTLADLLAPGEQFDAVTMMDVLEHVADPDALLAQAAAAVRPGGVLVVLTPDAGAPVSRLLGRRWPEVQRPGEHLVLFSRAGLVAALRRHGFVASSWHRTGKRASVGTLLDDVEPAAPAVVRAARRAVGGGRVAERVVELDPGTKLVVYARRLADGGSTPAHRPARVPKRAGRLAGVDDAIVEELEALAAAPRYGAWLYDAFARFVRGARVLEVGGGIGTFTQRMLDDGAAHVVVVEPEAQCAAVLEDRLASEPRAQVVREPLPGSPGVAAGAPFDLVVCQNVLEHINDDAAALADMAGVLAPDGRLALLVPAGPRLYGPLDDAYGHWRRYAPDDVRRLVEGAGLEVEELRPLNALGVLPWWVKNRRPGARVGASSLKAYEVLVGAWRPLEERLRPPVGLSVVCVARRSQPPATASG